jgi:hypothetical protein
MCIQQDATLHSSFYLETALHVSSVTTTHHQERIQLYLQHLLFVTPLLLPAAIVDELERSLNHHQERKQLYLQLTPPTAHSNQFQLFFDSGR